MRKLTGKYAHAPFLQFLAEFGLIGFTLLVIVAAQVFRRFWEATHIKSNQVLVTAALALILHFGIEIDLIYPPLIFLLASLTALAVASSSI